MPRTGRPRTRPKVGFGARLARFREAAGLTQEAFGEKIGLSFRMVAYWEGQADRPPPADQLAAMATVLRVTADELLGLAEPPPDRHILNRPLLRKFFLLEQLPHDARKVVLRVIDSLAAQHGIAVDGDAADAPVHAEPPPTFPRRRQRRAGARKTRPSSRKKLRSSKA